MNIKGSLNKKQTIKQFIKDKFPKESSIVKMPEKIKYKLESFSSTNIIQLFEETELSLYDIHVKNLESFNSKITPTLFKKHFKGLTNLELEIIMTGLKRLIGRVYHVHDIKNKLISELIEDFKDLFRHYECDEIEAEIKLWNDQKRTVKSGISFPYILI